VDFAIFIGEEKTLIYRNGQGIVLNEPSMVAYLNGKIIAVGKDTLQYLENPDVKFNQIIKFGNIQNVDAASVFLRALIKKVGTMGVCLICIPASLNQDGLNNYKTAIYSAGVADAMFIPSVVANLVASGHDLFNETKIMSIVMEGESADIAVIRGGEIIDGGSLYDIDRFEEARTQLEAKYSGIQSFHGDRMMIINGAGELLTKPDIVKKIIALN